MAKPTQLGTLFGMTGLFVALPLLLTFAVYRVWPDLSVLALTLITLALIGAGAWVFAAWFGD